MGKLDVNVMRHMSKDDFRVLTAVEMGMKNHHAVPVALVGSIAFGRVARKAATRNLTTLLRFKLVYHDNTKYDGYRLTWSGYDVLALRALCQRGVVASLGSKIGEGKESDVYEAFPGDDEESSLYAIKFHRLGKTSFKAVKTKRDYLEGRHMGNWLNMSRLAAKREWTVLSALHGVQKIRTPRPIDHNRHAVVMSLVSGLTMYQLNDFSRRDPAAVLGECLDVARTLAKRGLVHCDFNEFNLIVDDDEQVTVIDFPQAVSTDHPNAEEFFRRDVNGVLKFFRTKINNSRKGGDDDEHVDLDLDLEDDLFDLRRYAPADPDDPGRLDVSLRAPGYPRGGRRAAAAAAAATGDDDDDDDDPGEEVTDDDDVGEDPSSSNK